MVYVVVFALIALLEVLSAVLMFAFKDITHVVLALSLLFVFNSAMFFMLSQPLLALLQLFIMVGGVSTYIFVGVASTGYSKFKATDYRVLAIAYVTIFVLFSAKIAQIGTSAAQDNILTAQMIGSSLSSNIGILYLIMIMLFGVGIGSIILVNKISDKR
ncbi:MAG: hypothetical protein ACREBH_03580 [Candidatus Micrarchaeaceae archaeon]